MKALASFLFVVGGILIMVTGGVKFILAEAIMGLGRAVKNGAKAFENWLMDLNDSPAKATGKISLVCVVLMTAVVAPFVYVANKNDNALDEKMADLDGQPTVIFNSVADCVNKGFSRTECIKSEAEADDIASSLGTSLSYSSYSACNASHNDCHGETTMIPITTYVGNVPITNYIPSTSYYAPTVAWQAAQNNLSKAVPLYAGKSDNVGIRNDGKEFNLQ